MGHFRGVLVIDLSPSQLALAHSIRCHGDKQLHPQITAKLPPGIDQGLCLPSLYSKAQIYDQRLCFSFWHFM